ncbi:TPA: replication initiation protein, partial [Campylobacter fetus subsp. venerealis]|nr:replication initiation protein [Campylobacter fetus subsp. venerealis]
MNEMVKYNNNVNLLAFKNVSKLESDLFFSILAILKDKGTTEITIPYADLTRHIPWNLTIEETRLALISSAEKIVKTAIRWDTEDGTTIFALFEKFYIPNSQEPFLKVKINNTFSYILNHWDNGNFTIWKLQEYSNLNSKYTQTLYRILKQFRNSEDGKVTIFKNKWDEFRDFMDIPKSYQMSDIDKQILKPAIKELSAERDLFNDKKPIFENLTYKKIKDPKGRGRGGKVIGIEFYFTPEPKETKNQEPKKLKTRTDLFGNQVNDLDSYINRHFKVKNKFDGGYDT